MSKRLYIGNLPFSTTLEQLKEIFSKYGEIEEATIVANKYSGRSKGFGFVEYKEDSAAEAAISEMNNKEIEGREIVVKEAMPFDPDKPRKSFDRGPRRGGFDRGREQRDFNRSEDGQEETSNVVEEKQPEESVEESNKPEQAE